jgi:hypothetical protein
MAKEIEPTTPLAFVPDLTVLVVEFVGKSQPTKISWASRSEIPRKSKKAATNRNDLIQNNLAHYQNSASPISASTSPEIDHAKRVGLYMTEISMNNEGGVAFTTPL